MTKDEDYMSDYMSASVCYHGDGKGKERMRDDNKEQNVTRQLPR